MALVAQITPFANRISGIRIHTFRLLNWKTSILALRSWPDNSYDQAEALAHGSGVKETKK